MADNTNPAPSAEDEFGVSAEDEFGVNSTSFGGGFADALFQNVKPFSTILNHIGAGIEQGWGVKDEQDTLNKVSDTDYLKSKNEYIKGINDHFIRPAAYMATLIGQAPARAVGGVLGGIGGLAEGVATSLGEINKSVQENPNIDKSTKQFVNLIGAPAELAGDFAAGAGMEIIGSHDVQVMTAKARATASVGEGERGFFNTVPVSPENLNARLEASQAAVMPELPPIEPPQTDLHSVSRLMAPDLFQEWDNLKELKDNLRLSMDYLSGKRGEDQERAITTILARTGGDESALSEGELSRLNNARNLLEQSQTTESVQMAETRQRLAEADLKLRDLLPKLQEVKERTQAVLEGTDKESDAFRDFVQARALENSIKLQELQDKVAETYRNADTLIPDKPEKEVIPSGTTPKEIAPVSNPIGPEKYEWVHQTSSQEPLTLDNKPTFFTKKGTEPFYSSKEGIRKIGASVKLKNPLVESEMAPEKFTQIHDELIRQGMSPAIAKNTVKEMQEVFVHSGQFIDPAFQKALENLGYDGIISDKTFRGTHAVSFNPKEQVELNQEKNNPSVGNRPGLKEIPGTGKTKTRGLAKTVESEAVEKGLTESFSNLPEYNQINLKDQVNKVTDLINSDPKLAFQIAMGKVPAPTGVIPEMVFNGIKDIARESNDAETLRQLATESDLVRQSTVMAQRLRALAEGIDNTDPVAAMKVIQDARQSLLDSANIKASKQRIIKAAKDALKNAAPKEDEWNAFLDDLTCK